MTSFKMFHKRRTSKVIFEKEILKAYPPQIAAYTNRNFKSNITKEYVIFSQSKQIKLNDLFFFFKLLKNEFVKV